MNNIAYKEINFDSIILGTLISADCGGILKCSQADFAFQIKFQSEQNHRFKITIDVSDVKKIFKNVTGNQMVLDFKLKPPAIRNVGDSLRKSDFIFQISKNPDENKFQLYLNDISIEDVAFIEKFFASIDVFDQNVANVIKEPELLEQQQTSKIHKPNLLKHRKKKLMDSDPEDGSQDYHPQKRPRKQSFSKITADCEVIEEAVPKRSLRVRNRDEVNLCEDMSEEAQLQEALKRSLKGVDQNVIASLSHIEDQKSEKDLEHEELYDNIDKTIELFTYNSSNGDIIVRMEDYLCLSRNEYLSDVIIDFYLHYIYNVKMTPEQREKTLIIGAHFYTLYATSSEYSGWNDGLNAGLNAKEKRYRRIDGILKNDVNIFEKDYIIMPLMDHNHWFLAIVCFPKLNGSFTLDGNRVDENDVKRNPKKLYQPPIKSSCILIFDSVKGNGSRRTVAINHIKNFLEYEWINKYQQDFHFDVKCLNGHSPKVPLQMNNVDCGCFILEFMERFFVTSPIQDLRFPIDLGDWFSSEEVRSSKRRELAQVIRTMMESSNNQVELPNIRFYGDRKRKSSKSVQIIDLDKSLENSNNNNNNNGNLNETFRMPDNCNGNNNDENFNNNNDFYCLDSNNILQNGNVIQENQEAVHNITRDDEFIDAKVDRVTTQELMEYEQECYINDEMNNDGKTESVVLDASDEMEVDETPEIVMEKAGNCQEAEIEKVSEIEAINDSKMEDNETKVTENDSEIPEKDANVMKNDAKIVESDAIENNDANIIESDAKVIESDAKENNDEKLAENGAKIVENEAIENDAKLAETDAKIVENDAKLAENDAKIVENDAKLAENDAKIIENEAIENDDANMIDNPTKADEEEANVTINDVKVAGNDAEVKNDAKSGEDVNGPINDSKTENDAEVVKNDSKSEEKDANMQENDAKVHECDAKIDAGITKKSSDSDIEEIHFTPEKIDLTLDDIDSDEKEEPNYKISDIVNDDKMDIDPLEENNDQEPEKEQENQKSENMQSIADRISQSITLKESTTVLLD